MAAHTIPAKDSGTHSSKIFRLFVGFSLKWDFFCYIKGGCVNPAWPMLGYSIQSQVEYDSVILNYQQESFLLISKNSALSL